MNIYEKLGSKTSGIKGKVIEKPTAKAPKTGPVMHLDATSRMHAAEERAEQLEDLLKQAGSGKPLRIKLSELHQVAGRKRILTDEEYAELKNNLANNKLVTPITVRLRPNGDGYEIVSGHNRVQIYTELGRPDIEATILDTDDAQADLDAFYANLLHPDLPDFQKYCGFKMIQKNKPDLSVEGIATLTGKSLRHIEQLMMFDQLPEEALEILNQSNFEFGSNAVEDMAKLVKAGKSDKVIQAIEKLSNGEMNQKQAVSFASASDEVKPSRNLGGIQIKQGRSTYCTVRQASKILRLEFSSKEEAVAAQEAVTEALEKLAAGRKKSNG